jgi:hypothetical protein
MTPDDAADFLAQSVHTQYAPPPQVAHRTQAAIRQERQKHRAITYAQAIEDLRALGIEDAPQHWMDAVKYMRALHAQAIQEMRQLLHQARQHIEVVRCSQRNGTHPWTQPFDLYEAEIRLAAKL